MPFWANRSAAVADAAMPAPQARRNSRRSLRRADIHGQRHQAVGDRVDDQLGGLVDAERVHDVGAVDRHRVDAEIELLGDLAVRKAGADVLQHLELARRQPVTALALERRLFRHARIEHRLAGRDFPHGRREVEIERVLQDVAARARVERLAHQRVLRMHAEHEDGDLRVVAEDLPRGDETARARHGAIHHDNGRLELLGQRDRLVAIAGLADDVDRLVVFEHAPEAASHEAVIVGEEDGDLRVSHGRLTGHCHANESAAFGAARRNSSVPPTSAARSRMATMPRPRRADAPARPDP